MSPPPTPALLPVADRAAEDTFVAAMREGDNLDALVAAITGAMEARRPQLAARLVGLLDGRVEIPSGSPLERAARAASLLLLAPVAAQPALTEDLADAWHLANKLRMRHTKARMRARGQQTPGTLGSPATSRRKPRLTGRNRRG